MDIFIVSLSPFVNPPSLVGLLSKKKTASLCYYFS